MTQEDQFHDVFDKLSHLAPSGEEAQPAAGQAWQRLQSHLPPQSTHSSEPFSFLNVNTWRFPTMKKYSARFAAAGIAALLVAALFLFPGARATANQFLGMFRVQKFAPISVSPEALSQLENLELDGVYPGEFTWIQEPQEPQTVTTYDEAAAVANYDWWVLEFDDQLGSPSEIAATDGGSAILTVDLESSRTILDIAGIDPALLPDNLDGAEIEATVSGTIFTRWDENNVTLIQGNSPEVNYPAGFDPAPIGQAMLQLLGMSEDEAFRLSQNIDWTNTLILPIPQEIGTFREVSVQSTTGLLIEGLDGEHSALLWQNNERMYMVSGSLSGDELMTLVAE